VLQPQLLLHMPGHSFVLDHATPGTPLLFYGLSLLFPGSQLFFCNRLCNRQLSCSGMTLNIMASPSVCSCCCFFPPWPHGSLFCVFNERSWDVDYFKTIFPWVPAFSTVLRVKALVPPNTPAGAEATTTFLGLFI
jgi:hypothetical protein